jgi:hypothetical protein
MQRIWAILLMMALTIATLPCAAQDPIPFKSLAHMTGVQPSLADAHALTDGQAAPSGQAAKHRHWTKGGKIMTFIGVPVMAAGGAMMAYGMSNNNSTNCSAGSTCVSVDWKWTGVAWIAIGGTLSAIGVTRRSTE